LRARLRDDLTADRDRRYEAIDALARREGEKLPNLLAIHTALVVKSRRTHDNDRAGLGPCWAGARLVGRLLVGALFEREAGTLP